VRKHLFVRYRNELQQIFQFGYQEFQFNWEFYFKTGKKTSIIICHWECVWLSDLGGIGQLEACGNHVTSVTIVT
jgi:hypothetical protein